MSRKREIRGIAGRQVFSATPGAGPGDFDADSLSSIPSDFTPWPGGPKAPLPVPFNRNKTAVKNKRQTQSGSSPSASSKSKSTSKSSSKSSSKSMKTRSGSKTSALSVKPKNVKKSGSKKAKVAARAIGPHTPSNSPQLLSPLTQSTDQACPLKRSLGSVKLKRPPTKKSIISKSNTSSTKSKTKDKTSDNDKLINAIRHSLSDKSQVKKLNAGMEKIIELSKESLAKAPLNSSGKLGKQNRGQLSTKHDSMHKRDKISEIVSPKSSHGSHNLSPISSKKGKRISID